MSRSRWQPSPQYCRVGSRIWAFRGLLGVHSRYGLTARQITYVILSSKTPTASLPPPPLQLLPAGTTPCRTGLTPAEEQRLFTAYSTCGPYTATSSGLGTSTMGNRAVTARESVFPGKCDKNFQHLCPVLQVFVRRESSNWPIASRQTTVTLRGIGYAEALCTANSTTCSNPPQAPWPTDGMH